MVPGLRVEEEMLIPGVIRGKPNGARESNELGKRKNGVPSRTTALFLKQRNNGTRWNIGDITWVGLQDWAV